MKKLKVKAGDKVFVCGRAGIHLGTVQKITPTGRIKVNGSYYDKYGRLDSGDIWSERTIKEATENEIEEFEKCEFIKKVKIDMNNYRGCLSYEEAAIIDEILNNHIKTRGKTL